MYTDFHIFNLLYTVLYLNMCVQDIVIMKFLDFQMSSLFYYLPMYLFVYLFDDLFIYRCVYSLVHLRIGLSIYIYIYIIYI